MQVDLGRLCEPLGLDLAIRIGMDTGPVIAGVIGRHKFIYDLWGDTVNTASRMESPACPARIQVTAATQERLRDRYRFGERGEIEVKGKGRLGASSSSDRVKAFPELTSARVSATARTLRGGPDPRGPGPFVTRLSR